jgi:hypothetical protein
VVKDRRAAEALDKRLRSQTDAIVHALDGWAPIVAEAKAGEIWRLLGFKSWPLYISDVIVRASPRTLRKRKPRSGSGFVSCNGSWAVATAASARLRRKVCAASESRGAVAIFSPA